ncbi:unnamed protein product [Victoria cruziana]
MAKPSLLLPWSMHQRRGVKGPVTGHLKTRTASQAKVAGRPSQAKAVAKQQQPTLGGRSGSSRSPANQTSAPSRRTAASKGPSPSCSGPCHGKVSHRHQALASLSQARSELTTSSTPSPRRAAQAIPPKGPESRLGHPGLTLTQAESTSEGHGSRSSHADQTLAQRGPALEDPATGPNSHELGLVQAGIPDEALGARIGHFSLHLTQASPHPEAIESSPESHRSGLAQEDPQDEDLGSGPGHYSLALAQDGPHPEGPELRPSSTRASLTQADAAGPGYRSPDPCPNRPCTCVNPGLGQGGAAMNLMQDPALDSVTAHAFRSCHVWQSKLVRY